MNLQSVSILRLLTLAASVNCIAPSLAKTPILLTCTGLVKSGYAGANGPGEKQRLELVVDVDKREATVQGDWGCTLLAVTMFSCGSMPIRVSVWEDEIAFTAETKNDSISAGALFTINRMSGAMRTSSSMYNKQANPDSRLYSTRGEFQCEASKRQF